MKGPLAKRKEVKDTLLERQQCKKLFYEESGGRY
jgi:hypothetical protein